MTTRLDSALRRELIVEGRPYTLIVDPSGLKLTPKGRRKGFELAWKDFVSGEAAFATALNASLARAPEPVAGPPQTRRKTPARERRRPA